MTNAKKTASKGAPIVMPPPDDGLSPENDHPDPKRKPHYVEVKMTSVSAIGDDNYINQEIIVREYAETASELVEKNFALAGDLIGPLLASFGKIAESGGHKGGGK